MATLEKIENVPLDMIQDPHVPMRSQMDEEKLNELMASIKQHGLIQPITLRLVPWHVVAECPAPFVDVGGIKKCTHAQYEVVAGHRRFKACKRAGMATISAIVRTLDQAETDGMRMSENLYREDVNPVDEARYIRTMVDTHKVEPDELAKMTGKSESYLRARYDLLDYPEYLLKAVEAEQISLTAAQWLEKITDDRVRGEYTRFAIIGGITAKRAQAWYQSWTLGSLPRDAAAYVEPVPGPAAEPQKLMMPCVLCRFDDDIEKMGMYYAHRDCAQAVAKAQAEPGK